LVNFTTSTFALLTAFVMLYCACKGAPPVEHTASTADVRVARRCRSDRLPDSIRSSVCRSAHDYYVEEKKKLKNERPKSGKRVDDNASASMMSSDFLASDDHSDDEAYGIAPPKPACSREGSKNSSSPSLHASDTTVVSQSAAVLEWPVPQASPVPAAGMYSDAAAAAPLRRAARTSKDARVATDDGAAAANVDDV
jgi:hypothetical protein